MAKSSLVEQIAGKLSEAAKTNPAAEREEQEVLLRANGLSKIYNGVAKVEVRAVNDMHLEVFAGDFTAIMGNSGSGKSSLLYLLSGLDEATSGEVYIGGHRIDTMKEKGLALFRRRNIGFVYQGINLVPNMTLLENILLPGYLIEKNRRKVEERARELLHAVGLTDEADRLPAQVSGGQQQRGAIARALINSPRILFADEPTGSLNSAQGQSIIRLLKEINDQGQTVVMVTHDLKLACYAHRVLFIKDGCQEGVYRFEQDYDHEETVVREEKLFRWLTERGW